MDIGAIGESFDVEEMLSRVDSKEIKSELQKMQEEFFTTLPKRICDFQTSLEDQMKSLGNGDYQVSIEKDSTGKTTAGGSVSYESDRGAIVELGGHVDNQGNVSGKVSVGGKF